MSNISDLLREAAQEVALEEKEEAEEGIQKAVQQTNAQILRAASPRAAGIAIEDPIILPNNVDVNEDVNALLEQMSIKPKYSGNTIDDIDALLQMQKKKTTTVSNNSSRASMDNYRRRKSERETIRSTKSLATSRTFDGQSWNSTEMSRVSQLLAKADDKSWGKNIKNTFSTPQQELLFRSMKVVRPTKMNKQKQLLATAAGRLQKFETCDLNLHATKPHPTETATEERNKLHQSMRVSSDRLCTAPSKQPSRKALKADPTLRYATFDDAKECTFQPCIAGDKKKKKNNNDEDEDEKRGEDSKFAFINRMEAEERSRRDELEFAMGKAKYDALVDKKTCPRCGAKQSYDEFKEKRKSCVHCNVEYCAQVSWGKVGRRFFQSNLEFAQRVAEKKQRLRESLDVEFKCVQRTEIDPNTGKTISYLTERKQVLTPTEEMEFFDRMNEMMERREKEVKQLEEKVYTEKCPFKPIISSRNRNKNPDSEEEDDDDENDTENNPVRAFLKRYKTDLEDRRDKYPTKYAPNKSTRAQQEEKDSLQPFRMSKSVDRGNDMFLS